MRGPAPLQLSWSVLMLALPVVAVSGEPGIATGTVFEGRFLSFVVRTDTRSTPITWYCGDLATSQLQELQNVIPETAKYLSNMPTYGGSGWGPCTPERWRIRYGILWACFRQLENHLHENRSFYLIEFGWHDDFKIDYTQCGKRIERTDDSWRGRGGTVERRSRRRKWPLQRIADADLLRARQSGSVPPEFFEYDFAPIGPRELQLFLLIDNEMEVWKYSITPCWYEYRRDLDDELRRANLWQGIWELEDTFAPTFRCAFYVAELSGAVAFVTDSGKCYVASKNTNGIWTCSPVWDDESRPLIAMIDVPDKKESYAFGKNFYFLLGGKPAPVQCRDVILKDSDYGEPLRTSWECAKVLYADGRITAQRDETPAPGPSDARQNPR